MTKNAFSKPQSECTSLAKAIVFLDPSPQFWCLPLQREVRVIPDFLPGASRMALVSVHLVLSKCTPPFTPYHFPPPHPDNRLIVNLWGVFVKIFFFWKNTFLFLITLIAQTFAPPAHAGLKKSRSLAVLHLHIKSSFKPLLGSQSNKQNDSFSD